MTRPPLLVASCLTCLVSTAALAQTPAKQAADEVIALTRTLWVADIRKDVAGSLKGLADDYTEFNADFPTRLDGKALNAKLAEAGISGSGSVIAADMANEKVQVYGDVAILSYNYIGANKSSDGKISPVVAKSTRVYVKQGGQWMLVHANFGEAK